MPGPENTRRARTGQRAIDLHPDELDDWTKASDMIANICHALFGVGETGKAEELVGHEGKTENVRA